VRVREGARFGLMEQDKILSSNLVKLSDSGRFLRVGQFFKDSSPRRHKKPSAHLTQYRARRTGCGNDVFCGY